MSSPRAVLIGLPPTDSMVPAEFQSMIAKALAALEPMMADAGIEYEFIALSPDEGLSALGPKLQAQRPDVVIIGNGIRSNMGLTPWMEQIIEIVRTSAPKAKLGFNIRPDDSVNVVKRLLPTGTAAAAAKSA